MVTLKNFNESHNRINKTIINSLHDNCKRVIEEYLENQLLTQVNSEGERFPQKKESTKKSYLKKGYDTEHWLVRTGKSTRLVFKNTLKGFTVKPLDPNRILNNVADSKSWFTLNNQVTQKIISQIKKDLK